MNQHTMKVKYISPRKLKPLKYRFTKMSEEEYKELKTSIELSGFSEHLPIKVREVDNEFEIVDGHHRKDIALELKLEKVPIEVQTYKDESEAVADAIQSNKDRGAKDYFEISRSWEDIFGHYEKGKHGKYSQEDIGKLGGGFSTDNVKRIRPIYPRLKNIIKSVHVHFSNRGLIQFARVENDRLREALVNYSEKLSSDELQEKATLCNKISDYIEEKVESDDELTEKAYDALLDNDIVFKDTFEALQLLVDEIVDMPTRYLPTFIEGNALKMIPKRESESVHLIITSPPYGSLKDYKVEGQITSLTGYNRYLNELHETWEQCFRVLIPGGRLIVIIGDTVIKSGTSSPHRVIPIHAEIIKQCTDIGYSYMSNIIWQKINVKNLAGGGAFPGSYPFPRECLVDQAHEYVLIFRKPGDTQPESQQVKEASRIEKAEWSSFITSIWNIHGQKKTHHPAPFPEELINRLIRMFSFKREIIMDPFVGSGTTCISAMKLGRRSIGIDIKKEYLKTSKKLTRDIRELETDFRYI